MVNEDVAQARMFVAARALAGLDQAALGEAAGVSASTISNVERLNEAKPETLKVIRRALRRAGVTFTLDKINCLVVLALPFKSFELEDYLE